MKTLGKYELLEEIASGGMGKICRARDRVLHREVAIKTIFTGQTDPQIKQRFYREARACAVLSHPNIITVFDLGEQQGVSYIAMELLEGEDLRRFIDRRGIMSLEAKIGFICEVCDGLAHAHENGILHRDIKPGNIFVVKSGRPKILDFGVARIAASHLTLPGTTPGTPRYMSPEQLLGKECDALSDLFSAAVVFFEFLTYVHPFDDSDASTQGRKGGRAPARWVSPDVPNRVIKEEPLGLRSLNPAMPERLERILAKALSKDPQARHQTAAELGRELKKVSVDLVRECSRLWNEVLDSRKRILELEPQVGDYIGTSWVQDSLKRGNVDLASTEKIKPDASATVISGLHYLDLTEQLDEIKRMEGVLAHLSDDVTKARQDAEEAGVLMQKGDIDGATHIMRPLLERFPDHPRISSLMQEIRLRSSAAALEKALSENNLVQSLEFMNEIQAIGSANPEGTALIESLRSRVGDALAAKDLLCESVRATLNQLQNASTGEDGQRIETVMISLGELARELGRRYAGARIPDGIEGLLSSCETSLEDAKLRVARFKIRAALGRGDLQAVRQSLQVIRDLCARDPRYENHLLEAQREVVESVLIVPYAQPIAEAGVASDVPAEAPAAGKVETREKPPPAPAVVAGKADEMVPELAQYTQAPSDSGSEVQPHERAALAGLQRILKTLRLQARKRPWIRPPAE